MSARVRCVPEKGGALRNQSTEGRRLGVAAAICGVVLVAPLLLVQSTSSNASRPPSSGHGAASPRERAPTQGRAIGVKLRSHLVVYQAPNATTTTTTPPPPTSTATPPPPTTTTTAPPAPPAHTVTTAPAHTVVAPPPPTTTTTAPPPASTQVGQATWYSAASAGMCASPTLSFGTVLTVTNSATGASTRCTVDDREGAGYPRVVDMSPSDFSQIASLSQGVVEVTISW